MFCKLGFSTTYIIIFLFVHQEASDQWQPRSGIALALARIQPYYDEFMVTQAVSFFVPQALGDRNEIVRKDMLSAAVATIDNHGKNTVADLLPVFEDFLDNAPSDSSYDIVRHSVVILMGGLARHLDKDDPKVRQCNDHNQSFALMQNALSPSLFEENKTVRL